MFTGPKIVTDGLVLYLDAANPKSLDTRNLLYNTDSLTGWVTAPYGSVISITPNFTLAPDGTFTASKFQFTQGLAYRCIMRNALLKLGETNTFSVYAKAVSGTATFFLDIGDQGSKSFTVNDTEWTRCYITHTRTSQYGETTNFADITANLGTEVYLWGAQLNYGGLIDYVPVGNTSIPFRNLDNLSEGATLVNGPQYITGNKGGINFDGTNDYFTFPDLVFTNEPYTIELCGSLPGPINTSNRRTIFCDGSGVGEFSNSTTFFTTVYINGVLNSLNFSFVTAGSIQLNKVFHWVFTLNELGSVMMYLNGNPISNPNTQLVGNTTITTTYRRFGARGNGRYYNGNFYYSRFYDKVLTLGEVRQNYNAIKSRFNL